MNRPHNRQPLNKENKGFFIILLVVLLIIISIKIIANKSSQPANTQKQEIKEIKEDITMQQTKSLNTISENLNMMVSFVMLLPFVLILINIIIRGMRY